MTEIKFTQDGKLTGVRETPDGYLVAMVKCARTGIQRYLADEMRNEKGEKMLPDAPFVDLYRPESEVFSMDSLQTFVGKPVTDNHPPEQVTADNWNKYARGSIGEGVLRDGQFITVPITIMDAGLVKQVKDGKREISMGYSQNVTLSDGVSPQGEKYQAVASDLRMNHLAIVDRGRAGHECRVGDSDSVEWGISPLTIDNEESIMEPKNRTVMLDGLPVVTTEAGAFAIDKLTGDKKALDAQIVTLTADHKTAIAAKETELAAKDAEIDKLKAAAVTGAALDSLVSARASLVGDATLIAKDADFTGMTDDTVRKTAVAAVIGEDALDGKGQAYIDARFDILLEDAKGKEDDEDDMRKDMKHGKKNANKSSDNGQTAYEQSTSDAWKNAGAK